METINYLIYSANGSDRTKGRRGKKSSDDDDDEDEEAYELCDSVELDAQSSDDEEDEANEAIEEVVACSSNSSSSVSDEGPTKKQKTEPAFAPYTLKTVSFDTKESRDALFDSLGRDLYQELCAFAVWNCDL